MEKIKIVLIIVGILLLGVLGALIFNVFVMPYLLTDSYFERFQFVKDFKNGKIIINPKEQIYIQENVALENAIEKVAKSVVAIQVTTSTGNSYFGSGLITTSDGSIITLASLTPKGSKFNIFVNGEKTDFKVQKTDYKNNLILIKIEQNNLPTVGFASFDKIKLGQRVFLTAFSSIKITDRLANEGIVKSFNEEIIKTNISEKSIITGSPLFNIYGELVGLNYIDSDNKVSAVPINTIKTFLEL